MLVEFSKLLQPSEHARVIVQLLLAHHTQAQIPGVQYLQGGAP